MLCVNFQQQRMTPNKKNKNINKLINVKRYALLLAACCTRM